MYVGVYQARGTRSQKYLMFAQDAASHTLPATCKSVRANSDGFSQSGALVQAGMHVW